jgi:hypothetical protein
VKDGMIFDLSDEMIKGFRLDTKFLMKAFRAVDPPVVKEMELRALQYGWSRVENLSHPD